MRLCVVGVVAFCSLAFGVACATGETLTDDGTTPDIVGTGGTRDGGLPSGSGGSGATGGSSSSNGGSSVVVTGGTTGADTGGTTGVDTGGTGATNTGGTTSAVDGGPSETGGSSAEAGTGCTSAQKLCNGSCVTANAANGCSAASCTACTQPANGTAKCTSGQCDFNCATNYVKGDGVCTPAASCTDGTQNNSETDKDCGGGTCPVCAIGQKCNVPADCTTGSLCTGNLCTCAPKDCAAVGSCSATADDGCGHTIDCSCTSGVCYQNKCCVPACPASSCGTQSDGCGSTMNCGLCNDGASCSSGAECKNGACEGGKCVSCSDGKKNHGESDVDCGGPNCTKCAGGKACGGDSDCTGGHCCTALEQFYVLGCVVAPNTCKTQ